MSEIGLLARLKRARIVQVLVVYLGASWAILQVAETLQESLSLPAWVMPVAILLLLIGLLVVGATAMVQGNPATDRAEEAGEVPKTWAVAPAEALGDLTRFRLPHLTWGRAVLGGVVAMSLLFGAAGLAVLVQSGELPNPIGPTEAGADEAAEGIAIMPFAITGSDMDVWREGLVDLFATNLDGVGGLRTIDSRTVFARWRDFIPEGEEPDLQTTLQVGAETGARYVMIGSAVSLGGNLRLAATVHDLASGTEAAQARVDGDPAQILGLVDDLSVGVMRELLGEPENVIGLRSTATLTTSSMEALEAYLEGEAFYRRSNFTDAIQAMERALAADSSFAAAMVRMSFSCGWEPQNCPGDLGPEGWIEMAHARLSGLPARDQALIQSRFDFYFNTTPAGAWDLIRAAQRYPDDPELAMDLSELHVHRHVSGEIDTRLTTERLANVVELDPSFGPGYVHLIDAYAAAGDSAATADAIASLDRYGADRIRETQRLLMPLAFGDPTAYRDASERLRQLPFDGLIWVGPTAEGLDEWERLARARYPLISLSAALLARGKLDEWRGWLDTASAAAAARDRIAIVVAERILPIDATADRLDEFAGECGPIEGMEPGLGRSAGEACVASLLWLARQGRYSEFDAMRGALDEAIVNDSEELRVSAIGLVDGYDAWRRGDSRLAIDRLSVEVSRNTVLSDPAFSNARALLLGTLLAAEGRVQQAERHLLSIVRDRFDPVLSVAAWVYLAELYEGAGRATEAREAWQQFLVSWSEADPDLATLEEARAAVARLGG